MQLFDTHCHLDFSQFALNRAQVISDAHAAGVSDIMVPGVVAQGWPHLRQVVDSEPGLYCALGLHPCFMDQHREEDLLLLEQSLRQGGVYAVGEIGLDLFIENADLAQQLFYLEAQLELARCYALPVLLHVRKAHDQMLKALRRYRLPRGGIVHAFSGSLQQAEQYRVLGFKLGIGGTLTYDRATKLRSTVLAMRLDDLVLETDAPDMPLSRYRGEINQPARVREVAETLAQLKHCSLAEVAATTTATARKLFALES